MDEYATAQLPPTETPLCSANRRKNFQGEFSNRYRCHQVFLHLKHDFFLTAFCQLK
jgi:hypothetical protein